MCHKKIHVLFLIMDIISTFNLFRLKSKNYKYFADNIFLPHSNRTLKCYQEPLECKQGEPYARFDFITNPSIHMIDLFYNNAQFFKSKVQQT